MQKYVNHVDLKKLLQNESWIAKIDFDTAENEPSKILGNQPSPDSPMGVK